MKGKIGIAIALLFPFTSFIFFLIFNSFNDDPDFYLGGIQVNEPSHPHWISTLKHNDFNTVEVTVYAKQGNWDSENLWFEEQEPYVIAEIRAAKKRKMKVVLILRVALDHAFEANEHLWHGMIAPKSPEGLKEWFNRYQNFVAKWAQIAEDEEVDILSIGSEMNSLSATLPVYEMPGLHHYYLDTIKQQKRIEKLLEYTDSIATIEEWLRTKENPRLALKQQQLKQMRKKYNWAQQTLSWTNDSFDIEAYNEKRTALNQYWINTADTARSYFEGPLTYAANFDNYFDVGFWDTLDFIGINAYFQLRPDDSLQYTDTMLRQSWHNHFADIDSFKAAQGIQNHKVIFTELGYTYKQNSTLQPWRGFGYSLIDECENERMVVWPNQPVKKEERAAAVNALYAVHNQLDTLSPLKGILYWKLSTDSTHEAIEPFVLYVDERSKDPLLPALQRFMRR